MSEVGALAIKGLADRHKTNRPRSLFNVNLTDNGDETKSNYPIF